MNSAFQNDSISFSFPTPTLVFLATSGSTGGSGDHSAMLGIEPRSAAGKASRCLSLYYLLTPDPEVFRLFS